LKPEQVQELIAEARRRVDEIHAKARREVERVFFLLQDALAQANGPVDMSVKTSEEHRLATSAGTSPDDAHTPVLQAARHTVTSLVEKIGWSSALYSRARSGKSAIPEKWAKAIQEETRSEKFKDGIEPNGKFWPKGVRVTVK